MTCMVKKYHNLLCDEIPAFLNEYIKCPSLQRLKGISLFCGVDYCGLFHVKQYYSRLDHSIGVALILWKFTRDKRVTLAGLLHDVSTPVFSHAIDFMYKDYEKQEKTEEKNARMILQDTKLCALLKRDGIDVKDVLDYKMYPLADNEVPQLSADRLEYMYSTGLFLSDDFTMEEIQSTYNSLTVEKNEWGIDEFSFKENMQAELFVRNCCNVGKFFQTSEDKMALEYISRIVKDAIEENLFEEEDIYAFTEEKIWNLMKTKGNASLKRKMNFFEKLKRVKRSEEYVESECTISMNVKKRYIDPLISSKRSSLCNLECKKIIEEFLSYQDAKFTYIDKQCN